MTGRRSTFPAVAVLAGGIIGAGMFSLPFVFHAVGFSRGILYLAAAAVGYTFLHVLYGEIILATEGQHRFVGYTRRYLGKWAGGLSIIIAVLQGLLVLSIYLILADYFLSALSPSSFTGDIFFWLLGSIAIFLNLRKLAASETVVTASMLAIIVVLFGYSLRFIHGLSAPGLISLPQLLLPLPVILFALSGRVAISAVVNYFRGAGTALHARTIRWSIILGTLISAIAYGLFVYAVLLLSPDVSVDSISGLLPFIPGPLSVLVIVLGLLSLWSSYILVGLDIRDTMHFDLHFSKSLRSLAIVFIPLVLWMWGRSALLELVSFTGGVLLSLEGVLVVWMWLKIKQHHLLGLRAFGRGVVAVFLFVLFAAAFWAVIAG